jgi:hypothetical protein
LTKGACGSTLKKKKRIEREQKRGLNKMCMLLLLE